MGLKTNTDKTKRDGCYEGEFTATWGVMQGDPVSLTIFNIVVDAVVRQWLAVVCDLEILHHGQGCTVGGKGETLYSNNIRITSMGRGWVNDSYGETV